MSQSSTTSFLPFLVAVATYLAAPLAQLHAQTLSLDSFELRAYYPLTVDLRDTLGLQDTIEHGQATFDAGGLLSRCYNGRAGQGDSCLITTPQIEALADSLFAIQIDFRPTAFFDFVSNTPIFVLSRRSRALALQTAGEGQLVLMTNNLQRDTIPGASVELNTWFTATVIHSVRDSLTRVFLDGEQIYEKVGKLNRSDDGRDLDLVNANFGSGVPFYGYWRNLKVYRAEVGSPVSPTRRASKESRFATWPNPTSGQLNTILGEDASRIEVFDLMGRSVAQLPATTSVNLSQLPAGSYLLRAFAKTGESLGYARVVRR